MSTLAPLSDNGRGYGGYADWRYDPELTRVPGPADPQADSMEAVQEWHERQDRAAAMASPELLEQAAQRVEDGGSDSIPAAVWAITFSSGYLHGRGDAHAGTSRSLAGCLEGYVTGYQRGYRWAQAHPVTV